LLEQIASAGGGRVLAPGENPFVHDLEATPSVTPIWHVLALIGLCLFPVEIFVRRVVVPLHMITDPVLKALRKLPALGTLVPKPALRPAPVTGTYAARAATVRRFEAAQGTAPETFGAATATVAAGDQASAETVAQAPEKEKEKAAASDYTRQLLAAKERAIAKKTRRTQGVEKDE
jgi:hypothetical protein